MSDKPIETPRIAPFTDEQIEEADRRIEQIEGILSEAEELRDAGIITAAQIDDLKKTLATAKKVRSIMDRRMPKRK